MNKLKALIKKIIWFFIDSFAWFIVLCSVILALGILKSGLFGTVITLLFAFFISPLRRKILAKYRVKLKKKFVVIIGAILCFMSLYQIGTSDLATTTEAEVVSVDASTIETEEKEENSLTEESTKTTIPEEKIEVVETVGPVVIVQAEEPKKEPEIEKPTEEVQQANNTTENEDKTEKVVVEQAKLPNVEEKTVEIQVASQEPIESNLAVHFIDVGQGDATLFICDGEAMLLDAGTTSSGTSIQLYLKKRGISNLKYLILTHPDEDHIGGADVIITKYNIENVFMPSYERDTKAYEELINALEYKWMKWSTPSVGSTYLLGGATFTVIAPNRNYEDVNESSMGILVTHGNNKFLFTGDAEGEAESDIIRNGIDLDCKVFKAGHHGSKTSNSSELLKAATPEYVVISCGADNSYGHPHAGPMNDFRSMGVKLFRTDEQGTIVVESDGNSLTWNTSPTDSWKAGESTQNSSSSGSISNHSQSNQSTPAPVPTPEPEPIPQPAGNNFAVNGKNGKIHIVGACPATGTGKSSMKEPIYFETFEEAEAYSIQYHPGQDKRKCGNCY